MTKLSSKATFFWKSIFPVIIFFASILFSADMIKDNEPFYIVLILGIFLIAYSVAAVRKTKNISHDSEFLYIEDSQEDIKIPLTRILEINEYWLTPRTATIVLKEPCRLGQKVRYIQRFKPFLFTANHPDVLRLYETLRKNAKKELETSKKEKGRIYRLFADKS